jgi:hypothetical protein
MIAASATFNASAASTYSLIQDRAEGRFLRMTFCNRSVKLLLGNSMVFLLVMVPPTFIYTRIFRGDWIVFLCPAFPTLGAIEAKAFRPHPVKRMEGDDRITVPLDSGVYYREVAGVVPKFNFGHGE